MFITEVSQEYRMMLDRQGGVPRNLAKRAADALSTLLKFHLQNDPRDVNFTLSTAEYLAELRAWLAEKPAITKESSD